jgi:transcriptional regulator with XRE-family HTH domain
MTESVPLINNELDMSTFPERLKLLRSARNITQTKLAEMIATDPRVYNRWKRGVATPQLDTVVKIADILQVTLDELIGRKEASLDLKIHNHELHTLYQKVDTLSNEEQEALILVIDSFVKRNQMAKVMGTMS